MNRGKLTKITAMFFALMLCFTLLSRAADQAGIAVVQTQRPQNMMIAHQIKATGRVVQNQELAVVTQANQRVTAIYVREGERVSAGDLLFEVDLDLLEEKILYQEQELEKQRLTVNDVKSQKAVSEQQKANEQAQAAEQYSLSVNSANVQLSRAKEQLEEAKEALAAFQESSGSTQTDSSVEAALEQALEDKVNAYVTACQELTSLQWKIENAVNTALQNAAGGALLTQNTAVRTQSVEDIYEEETTGMPQSIQLGSASDDYDEIIVDMESTAADGSAGISGNGAGISGSGTGSPGSGAGISGSGAGESGGSDAGGNEAGSNINAGTGLTIDAVEVAGGSTQADSSWADSSTGSSEDAEAGVSGDADTDILIEDDDTARTQSGSGTSGKALTQAELDSIEASVRNSYSSELTAAQKKVEEAKTARDEAETALMKYQEESLAAANASNTETAQQLAANVKTAQQAYEDAAIAANEAAVTSGRAVAAANIASASDSSDRMNEITYEQMELELQKLKGLRADEGKIYAEADGLVMSINIQTGEMTTDSTAIRMADLSQGYRFTADITKEQAKYIGTGDLVTLKDANNKLELDELAVESVAADEEDESIYHVTVQLPGDTFEIGTSVTMEFTRKSEAYSVTVPLSALHLDEQNQPYVLVPQEYDSIMGTETKALKVSVTILEQNESYAALAEGALASTQEIIISSDKAVDDGSRIRVG